MYAEWSKFIKGHVDLPSVSVYKDFLKELSRTLRRDAEDEHQLFIPITSRAMIHLADKTTQCGLCREAFHLLYLCSTFNLTNPEKKLEMAKQQAACINCLTVGHKPKDCRSIKRCRTCNGRHHSLLHLETRISKPADSNQSQPTTTLLSAIKSAWKQTNSHNSELPSSLLMTAQFVIKAESGNRVKIRALLDTGSSAHFLPIE